jgi:hypothetical protein
MIYDKVGVDQSISMACPLTFQKTPAVVSRVSVRVVRGAEGAGTTVGWNGTKLVSSPQPDSRVIGEPIGAVEGSTPEYETMAP